VRFSCSRVHKVTLSGLARGLVLDHLPAQDCMWYANVSSRGRPRLQRGSGPFSARDFDISLNEEAKQFIKSKVAQSKEKGLVVHCAPFGYTWQKSAVDDDSKKNKQKKKTKKGATKKKKPAAKRQKVNSSKKAKPVSSDSEEDSSSESSSEEDSDEEYKATAMRD
jgi:hypothetical protein